MAEESMRILGKTIQLGTKALAIGLFGLVGCEEPTTFVPTTTNEFSYYDQDLYSQANRVLQADYLFVADYSGSMSTKVNDIVNSMDLFAEYLQSENIDYKIGFVHGTTSTRGDTTTYIPNTLVGPAITPSATNLSSLIDLQIAGFGAANGPNGRFILEAARRTANNSSLSFIRNPAQLVYVFISDWDDESVNHPRLGNLSLQSYVSALGVKSDSSYVNARAWVNGVGDDCPAEIVVGTTRSGPLLAAAARGLNTGTSEAVQCLNNSQGMADSLEDLARDVTRPTKRFKLRATPVANSIVITIDGAASLSGLDWNYSAGTNEIIFIDGSEPAAGSRLDIRYSPKLQLSNSPAVSSIVVKADGVTVRRNASDGWSINEATREILFKGSYKPADGAKISVTYQSK